MLVRAADVRPLATVASTLSRWQSTHHCTLVCSMPCTERGGLARLLTLLTEEAHQLAPLNSSQSHARWHSTPNHLTMCGPPLTLAAACPALEATYTALREHLTWSRGSWRVLQAPRG